jgi:hypothetical protein
MASFPASSISRTWGRQSIHSSKAPGPRPTGEINGFCSRLLQVFGNTQNLRVFMVLFPKISVEFTLTLERVRLPSALILLLLRIQHGYTQVPPARGEKSHLLQIPSSAKSPAHAESSSRVRFFTESYICHN